MIERGTIASVEGKLVSVAIEMHEGCESCINSSCKTRRSAIQACNRDSFSLAEGDLVDVEVRGAEQAKGAFWVLGLPLVALFAGYGLGMVLFPGSGEGASVATSGLSFLLALGVGMLVQRGKRMDSLPVVLRKVD
ncbi:MAG: SoxR reducing system RseC family protein [Rectinema sp.]